MEIENSQLEGGGAVRSGQRATVTWREPLLAVAAGGATVVLGVMLTEGTVGQCNWKLKLFNVVGARKSRAQSDLRIEGVKVTPRRIPSGLKKRVTTCPQGSSRAQNQISKEAGGTASLNILKSCR
jgi:hypothetical protein